MVCHVALVKSRRRHLADVLRGAGRKKRAHLRVSEEGRHRNVQVQNVRDHDVALVDVMRDVGRMRCWYRTRLGGREREREG